MQENNSKSVVSQELCKQFSSVFHLGDLTEVKSLVAVLNSFKLQTYESPELFKLLIFILKDFADVTNKSELYEKTCRQIKCLLEREHSELVDFLISVIQSEKECQQQPASFGSTLFTLRQTPTLKKKRPIEDSLEANSLKKARKDIKYYNYVPPPSTLHTIMRANHEDQSSGPVTAVESKLLPILSKDKAQVVAFVQKSSAQLAHPPVLTGQRIVIKVDKNGTILNPAVIKSVKSMPSKKAPTPTYPQSPQDKPSPNFSVKEVKLEAVDKIVSTPIESISGNFSSNSIVHHDQINNKYQAQEPNAINLPVEKSVSKEINGTLKTQIENIVKSEIVGAKPNLDLSIDNDITEKAIACTDISVQLSDKTSLSSSCERGTKNSRFISTNEISEQTSKTTSIMPSETSSSESASDINKVEVESISVNPPFSMTPNIQSATISVTKTVVEHNHFKIKPDVQQKNSLHPKNIATTWPMKSLSNRPGVLRADIDQFAAALVNGTYSNLSDGTDLNHEKSEKDVAITMGREDTGEKAVVDVVGLNDSPSENTSIDTQNESILKNTTLKLDSQEKDIMQVKMPFYCSPKAKKQLKYETQVMDLSMTSMNGTNLSHGIDGSDIIASNQHPRIISLNFAETNAGPGKKIVCKVDFQKHRAESLSASSATGGVGSDQSQLQTVTSTVQTTQENENECEIETDQYGYLTNAPVSQNSIECIRKVIDNIGEPLNLSTKVQNIAPKVNEEIALVPIDTVKLAELAQPSVQMIPNAVENTFCVSKTYLTETPQNDPNNQACYNAVRSNIVDENNNESKSKNCASYMTNDNMSETLMPTSTKPMKELYRNSDTYVKYLSNEDIRNLLLKDDEEEKAQPIENDPSRFENSTQIHQSGNLPNSLFQIPVIHNNIHHQLSSSTLSSQCHLQSLMNPKQLTSEEIVTGSRILQGCESSQSAFKTQAHLVPSTDSGANLYENHPASLHGVLDTSFEAPSYLARLMSEPETMTTSDMWGARHVTRKRSKRNLKTKPDETQK